MIAKAMVGDASTAALGINGRIYLSTDELYELTLSALNRHPENRPEALCSALAKLEEEILRREEE